MIRRLIPFLVGLVAGAIGGAIGWALIRLDVLVWESAGFAAGPEMVLVVFLAVVFGVIATFLSWRALVGPPIEHAEWTLEFPAGKAATLVTPGVPVAPRVGDLLERLSRFGYRIESTLLDEAARPMGAAAEEAQLPGISLQLVDRRLGEQGGRVILRVPPRRGDGVETVGFLDSWSAVDGPHEEMARFLVAALGDLFPGVSFKRMDSALGAEPAGSIRDELPEAPRHLARLDARD